MLSLIANEPHFGRRVMKEIAKKNNGLKDNLRVKNDTSISKIRELQNA
jgi:hypothetical protein